MKTKEHVHDKISSSIIDHNKFIQSIEISIKNYIYMYLCSIIILSPYFLFCFWYKNMRFVYIFLNFNLLMLQLQ